MKSDIENRFGNVAGYFGRKNHCEQMWDDDHAMRRDAGVFFCGKKTSRARRQFTVHLKNKTGGCCRRNIYLNGAGIVV